MGAPSGTAAPGVAPSPAGGAAGTGTAAPGRFAGMTIEPMGAACPGARGAVAGPEVTSSDGGAFSSVGVALLASSRAELREKT